MNEALGSGRRFRALESRLAASKSVKNPAALAAAIGRKKYGAARMAQLSARGRKRAEREREAGADAPVKLPSRRVKV